MKKGSDSSCEPWDLWYYTGISRYTENDGYDETTENWVCFMYW